MGKFNLKWGNEKRNNKNFFNNNINFYCIMLIFDFIILILLFFLCITLLCGYLSLCERKVLAIVHLRIGPGLFLFGMLAPLMDGVKLMFKTWSLLINFDFLFFAISCVCALVSIGMSWFFLPIGYLIFLDYFYTIIFLSMIHFITVFICFFLVCFFLFNSIFVYMAVLRLILFTIILENFFFLFLWIFFFINNIAFFSLKLLMYDQLYTYNIWILGLFFFFIFLCICFLDTFRLPFDYTEAESELILGLITEFSGIFFVIYSLLESNHILITIITIISLFFGGTNIIIKILLCYLILFLFPRAMLVRFRILTTINLILLYIYIYIFIFLFGLLLIKYIL